MTLLTLEEILNSNQKSSLLAFLMLAPNRYFSAVELSRRIGLSSATISTTLEEFKEEDLIVTTRRGPTTFYSFNARHTLAAEMRVWLAKNNSKYEDELFSAIRKVGEVKAVVLSGVFTGQPQLPVDLLIVGKINLQKMDEFLQQCNKMMDTEINYSIMSEGEFKLRRDTFDRFIKDIFDYPHLTIIDSLSPKAQKDTKDIAKQ